jgi:dolichol-phosphate mannosyltransferase
VNRFKFLYELLVVSKGQLHLAEIPLTFQPRNYGQSKLDLAVAWDFLISILHSLSLRVLPRQAISFGLVGTICVAIQLLINQRLMMMGGLSFSQTLPLAVISSASSNYLINNAITLRFQRLQRLAMLRELLKFPLATLLSILANVGLALAFYRFIAHATLWAQLVRTLKVYAWTYTASSRFS